MSSAALRSPSALVAGLFGDDAGEEAVVLPDVRPPTGSRFCETASASSASCRASARRPGWFCSRSASSVRRCPSCVGFAIRRSASSAFRYHSSASSGLPASCASDGKLAPGLRGRRQVTPLLVDPCCLAVVPFRFRRLTLFVVDPPELMPGGRFEVRLVELLKQSQRRLLTRQRLLQLSFRQRERAELGQVHALAPEVFQFLGDFQGRFVRLLRVAVLAGGAKRIPELRPQRAPQAFHAVAWREPADDIRAHPAGAAPTGRSGRPCRSIDPAVRESPPCRSSAHRRAGRGWLRRPPSPGLPDPGPATAGHACPRRRTTPARPPLTSPVDHHLTARRSRPVRLPARG